jgi:hypothetical protein
MSGSGHCSVTVQRPGAEARVVRHDQVLEGEDVLPAFGLPLAVFFAVSPSR